MYIYNYMIVFMSENSEVDFYFSDFCCIIKRRVDTFMLHSDMYTSYRSYTGRRSYNFDGRN